MNTRKHDRHNTAFVCHTGRFQCIRMTFGSNNALYSFQLALYLVLTFSNTAEYHILHVDEIWTTSKDAVIRSKIKQFHSFNVKLNAFVTWRSPDTWVFTKPTWHYFATSNPNDRNTTKIVLRILKCVSPFHWRFYRTCISVKKFERKEHQIRSSLTKNRRRYLTALPIRSDKLQLWPYQGATLHTS